MVLLSDLSISYRGRWIISPFVRFTHIANLFQVRKRAKKDRIDEIVVVKA